MQANIIVNSDWFANSLREVVDPVFPFPGSSAGCAIEDTFIRWLFANFVIPFEYMIPFVVFFVHVLKSFLQSVLIIVFSWLVNILARRNMFELTTVSFTLGTLARDCCLDAEDHSDKGKIQGQAEQD